MKRGVAVALSCAVAVIVSACQPPAPSSSLTPPEKLVGLATMASISHVSKSTSGAPSIAYYSAPGLLGDGQLIGALHVLEGGSSASVSVDGAAFGAAFARGGGEQLRYYTNPTLSTDSVVSSVYYGAATVWSAAQGSTKLTTGLATWQAMPPDGSYWLLLDAARPSRAAAGDLLLARFTPSGNCAPAPCKPITLASNVTLTDLAVSQDGRFAAYVTRAQTAPGAVPRFEAWLVGVADARSTRLFATESAAGHVPIALSPSGALLATATATAPGGGSGGSLQLQMWSTTSMTVIPWSDTGAQNNVLDLAFLDDEAVLAHLSSATGDLGAHKLSAGQNTRLTMGLKAFSLAGPDNRFLVAATSLAAATQSTNLVLYDLQAAKPTPAPLSMATPWPPPLAVSADGSTIAFLDGYDATMGTAKLSLYNVAAGSGAPLSAGVPVVSDTLITQGMGSAGGIALPPFAIAIANSNLPSPFSFVPGGSALLYENNPSAHGAATLTVGATPIERGIYNFTATSATVIYASLTEPDPNESPLRSPGIYRLSLE